MYIWGVRTVLTQGLINGRWLVVDLGIENPCALPSSTLEERGIQKNHGCSRDTFTLDAEV